MQSLIVKSKLLSREIFEIKKCLKDENLHIHSIFNHSLNIISNDDNLIINIQEGIELLTPFSIGIESSISRLTSQIDLTPGANVKFCEQISIIGKKGKLTLLYEKAPSWEPGLKPRDYIPDDNHLLNQLNLMKRTIMEFHQEEGFKPIAMLINEKGISIPKGIELNSLCKMAYEPIRKLYVSLKTFDSNKFINSFNELTGLGIGLTPSGDDFLSGVIGPLLLASPRHAMFIYNHADNIMKMAEKNTSRLSREFIKYSLERKFSIPLSRLYSGLFDRNISPETIYPDIKKVVCIGETSGVDTIAGIMTGLSILIH